MMNFDPTAPESVLLASLDICPPCLKRGATKKCAACKCCKYCSVECQRSHWKIHKKMCPSLKAAGRATHAKETNLIVQETQQQQTTNKDNNETEEEGNETTQQPEGYDLYSQGLDLQNGMKDFLKGYPDPEKMKGGEIEPNPEEGSRLIMEAAKLGVKGAQYMTALNYLPGGIYHEKYEESMKEVQHWIERAAMNGHAEAQVTYGNKMWIEGHEGTHPIDPDKGLYWLRKALAHGVTDGGDPDPMGGALSEKSFKSTLDVALRTARQLFLTKYSPLAPEYDDGASDNEERLHICADCGVGGALHHVILIKGQKDKSTIMNERQNLGST